MISKNELVGELNVVKTYFQNIIKMQELMKVDLNDSWNKNEVFDKAQQD